MEIFTIKAYSLIFLYIYTQNKRDKTSLHIFKIYNIYKQIINK